MLLLNPPSFVRNTLTMDGLQKPLTPTYLPAMEAIITKQCRFCHQSMEIKQINLTEAVRQCYKCSTPFRDLNPSDIDFFHRSYRDIHKNPKDWSLNVGSEEDELHCLQSWMEKFSLTMSKYEDSSDDDDEPADCNKNGNKMVQKDSVSQSDDLGLLGLVNELQQSLNCPYTQSEWNNAAIDELDAALAKASCEKADSASLPFSFEDLLYPEHLPQNPANHLNCVHPTESPAFEKNVSNAEKEDIHDHLILSTKLVVPNDELSHYGNKKEQEVDWKTTQKALVNEDICGTNKDSVVVKKVIETSSSLIDEITVSRKTVCNPEGLLPKKAKTLGVTSPPYTTDVCETLGLKNGLDGDKNTLNIQEKADGCEGKCETNNDIQEKNIAIKKQFTDIHSTSDKDTDVTDNDSVFICDTSEKVVSNDNCVYICKTPEKDTEVNGHCVLMDTDLNDDCVNNSNTPHKDTNSINVSVNILETVIDRNEKVINTGNNQSNASVNAEFHTSTPQPVLKGKYYKVSKMQLNPGPSVTASLNSHNFVFPSQNNTFRLDETGIFSAYQSETVVPRVFCDCGDDSFQLSSSTQEKEENHCIDLKLPNLSVSSIMEKEVWDDLEEDLGCLPSDLEKIIFSPMVTSKKGNSLKSIKKTGNEMKPTKLLLDTSEHTVSEPPEIASPSSTDLTNSILVTVPADNDITPEMLQLSNLHDMPIFFEGLDGVLQNTGDVVQVKDPFRGHVSEPVLQVFVDEFGTIVPCGDENENNEVSADPIEANVTKYKKVDFVEDTGSVIHCEMNENDPIEETVTLHVEDTAGSSDSTEHFSLSYSVSDDAAGFRIDVNRRETKNCGSPGPSVLSAQLTDVGFEKQNPVCLFEDAASKPQFLEQFNVPVSEPLKNGISSEFSHSDYTEVDFAERSDSLNNEACSSRSVQSDLTGETQYTKTEERLSRFDRVVNQPLKHVEDEDDELKSFTGAKFSLLAKRKKGAKVTPDTKVTPNTKVVNLMHVVQKEVTMTNTKRKSKLNKK